MEHTGSPPHRHVRPRRGVRLTIVAATAAGATALLAGRPPGASARQDERPVAQQSAVHAAQLAGEYWGSLAPRERQAYLTGFLAGAAAEQARAAAEAAGRAGDSAAVSSGAIAALRAARQLHFRFAPPVYSAQVDDFYWWKNHAPVPIVDAMIHINREMLKQQPGRP